MKRLFRLIFKKEINSLYGYCSSKIGQIENRINQIGTEFVGLEEKYYKLKKENTKNKRLATYYKNKYYSLSGVMIK